jgi:hypothetical protein
MLKQMVITHSSHDLRYSGLIDKFREACSAMQNGVHLYGFDSIGSDIRYVKNYFEAADGYDLVGRGFYLSNPDSQSEREKLDIGYNRSWKIASPTKISVD